MRRVPGRIPFALLGVVCLTAFKSTAAAVVAVAAPAAPGNGSAFPPVVYLLNLLVFSLAGLWLVLGSRQDERARYLGAVYLVIGAMFADRPLTAAAIGDGRRFLLLLRDLDPVAFGPWLLWQFAQRFPRDLAPGRWREAGLAVTRACGWIGAALFLLSVWDALTSITAAAPDTVPHDARAYWLFLILAFLGALLLIVRNTRAAAPDEQRRVRLFVAGLLVGFVPMGADVLLELAIPAFGAWMDRPDVRPWSGWIFYPLLLSVPLTTGYAVVVDRVLSVRVVLRRAIRYALARASIVAMLSVPFAALLWYLYTHRHEPLLSFLQGRRQLILLGLVGAGVLLLRVRRQLLTSLDRRFFREQYDAHLTLRGLIEESRSASSVESLAELIERDIDRALHVDRVSLFVADIDGTHLICRRSGVAPLALDSALAVLLRGSSDPLPINLTDPRSPLTRLPVGERQWLESGGFRILVPVTGGETPSLRGMIAIGPKRSELSFSADDRSLLSAIAASSAVVMENLRLRTPHDSSSGGRVTSVPDARTTSGDGAARECSRCAMVQETERETCWSCRGPLVPAPLPLVIRSVFRVERRIGAGGMGVVYRATDLNLGRPVAIKTLPEVSPERVTRMRREGRTMASLNHPHLATIFAVEIWRNTPLLVVEYFESGTLGDRLQRGPMTTAEALTVGAAVASGLERVHGAGYLHRDVKPSNIAFTADGTPKLLDFGLAKLIDQADTLELTVPVSDSANASTAILSQGSATESRRVIGTPSYLSPESVAMQLPDAGVDLWALAMVVYESIAGRNPVRAVTIFETMARITSAEIPDIREVEPSVPSSVANYLAAALHKDRTRRPKSAAQMRAHLEVLARSVVRKLD